MTELGDLWAQLQPILQGTVLGGLLLALLRIMYVERREHRDAIQIKNERIAELEVAHHETLKRLQGVIDAERDKRRAAEDAAAAAKRSDDLQRHRRGRDDPPSAPA